MSSRTGTGTIVHRATARVKVYAKVTIGIGDWVRYADHRGEFAGRVGKVIDITEWVEGDTGHGRGACLKVKFFGPSVMGYKGGTTSTGAQSFEYFGPASEDGYEWRGAWRNIRRTGAKPAPADTGKCWSCGKVAGWLRRDAAEGTAFSCSKHLPEVTSS